MAIQHLTILGPHWIGNTLSRHAKRQQWVLVLDGLDIPVKKITSRVQRLQVRVRKRKLVMR